MISKVCYQYKRSRQVVVHEPAFTKGKRMGTRGFPRKAMSSRGFHFHQWKGKEETPPGVALPLSWLFYVSLSIQFPSNPFPCILSCLLGCSKHASQHTSRGNLLPISVEENCNSKFRISELERVSVSGYFQVLIVNYELVSSQWEK